MGSVDPATSAQIGQWVSSIKGIIWHGHCFVFRTKMTGRRYGMVQIRNATRQELATIIEWAAAEGWNPGTDDLSPFWSADPKGYLVLEDEGAIKAAISLVRHSPAFAFLGFYMVTPSVRGQGLGLTLWQHATETAKGMIVGLDGVVAQQENYRKSGFAYAHANIRYGGDVAVNFEFPGHIFPADQMPMDQLLSYDEKHNPCQRDAFMGTWLTDSETRKSLVFLQDSEIAGLGTIRKCQSGYKIGPLFANTAAIADQLFQGLVATVGGGEIFSIFPNPMMQQNNFARAMACNRSSRPPACIPEACRNCRCPTFSGSRLLNWVGFCPSILAGTIFVKY